MLTTTGRKRNALLALTLAGITGWVGTGCKEQSALPQEVTDVLPLGQKLPLAVAMASPGGTLDSLDDSTAIVVAFNQPMVPLQPVPTALTGEPFKIEPPVSGRFLWKGTATLTFQPNRKLPYGTHFKVTVPAGTRSWAGEQLAKDYVFDFETPPPALQRSVPANEANKVSANSKLFLHFDQPMSAEKARDHLVLTAGNQTVPIEVRSYQPDDVKTESDHLALEGVGGTDTDSYSSPTPLTSENLQNNLVVVPQAPLPLNTTFALTLKEGLVGQQGPIGTKEPKVLTFSTYGPLSLKSDAKNEKVDPENTFSVEFTNPVSGASVAANLKIDPPLPIPDGLADDKSTSSTVSLYYHLQPRTHYTLTLGAGLTDAFGQKLGKDVTIEIDTRDYDPNLTMAEGVGLLEQDGPHSIPIGIRNVDKVAFQLSRVDRSQIVPLVSNTKALSSTEPYTPPSGFSRTVTLPPSDQPNKVQDRKLEFTPADGNLIYVQQVGNVTGDTIRSLVQITDIGLTGKFSPESSVIYVTSLRDTHPLANADIEIRTDDNRVVWTGKSDAEGLAQAPGWAALGLKKKEQWSVPTLWIIARSGSQITFMRTDGGGSISPWDFHIDYNWNQDARTFAGQAESERGLYRPGESVHFKGFIREIKNSHWTLPELGDLRYVVTDSRDQQIANGTCPINAYGTFQTTLKLKPGAPTGTYSINYSLPQELIDRLKISGQVASSTFRVEAFHPAELEVTVKPSRDFYVMGDQALAEVNARFLFGAPMPGAKMKWVARLDPYRPQPDGYEGYDFAPSFTDDSSQDSSQELGKAETTLDANGSASVQVACKPASFHGSGNLVLEATVTSDARQEISAQGGAVVYPGEYLVGLKPDTSMGAVGKPLKVSVVTVDPKGKPSPGHNVKLELVRREWKSVRKADVTGRYEWTSEAVDTPVTTKDATTGTEPTVVELTPDKPGYYVIKATSTDSRQNVINSDTSSYISGDGYVGWKREEGDNIELVADKKSYKPGETAHVLIKSPYEKARALITLERDSILSRRVVEVTGSAPTIDIPLTSEHLPNVYVSVVLLSGRLADKGFGPDGTDLGKPSFKIGYVNLPVEASEKHLKVAVKTDKSTYQPGDMVKLSVDVTNSLGKGAQSEVGLAVADMGVLNLINFEITDPFQTFYGPRALSVRTVETRMDVIGQRAYGAKGGNPGGGGSDLLSRQNFDYTAYWNPHVVTDASGHAEVTFKLPDNLTTFKAMASAATASSDFGAGTARLTVQKPLMLTPSMPSFARSGDELQVGAVVHNNSDKPLTVKLSAQATGVDISGDTTRSVTLQPGKDQEVLFPAKAPKDTIASLTFQAEGGDFKDAVTFKLPVHTELVTETVATSGSTDAASAREAIAPKNMVPGSGTVTVAVSATAAVGLDGAITYILEYPFGCLEQRMSRVLPILEVSQLVGALQIPNFPKAKLHDSVVKEFDNLPTFQREDGGFGLWPDTSENSSDYLTGYTLEVLAKAKAMGYAVDDKMVEKAIGYLHKVRDNSDRKTYPYSKDEELVNRAYAAYVLGLWDDHDEGTLNTLFGARATMPVLGKAYLLTASRLAGKAAMATALEQDLVNKARIEAETVYFSEADTIELPWLYSNKVSTTAQVLRALLSNPKGFPMAPKVVRYLMESREKSGHWGDTHTDAAVVDALNLYVSKYERNVPNFDLTASLGDRQVLKQSFKGRDLTSHTFKSSVGSSSAALDFKKTGTGRFYYDASMTYAVSGDQQAKDAGMAVFKMVSSTTPGETARPTQFTAGHNYKVTLTVVTPQARRFVSLVDPIPAGFEVVHTDFATTSDSLRAILNQAGANRGWWTFSHFEQYDDRVQLFADGLESGEHTFAYLVRAMLPGSYAAPATKAEEMYHPEVFGTTAPGRVTIK